MPISMTNAPAPADFGHHSVDDAIGDDFMQAVAGLKPLARHLPFFAIRLRGLLGKSMAPGSSEDRHVAFDGYRSGQHDDKIERDRRYGTVYTVTEYENAYLVRLELPRRMPSSSLKQVWRLDDARPEYDFTIELSHNVLAIRARLRGEALRRLAYISASFPSGFLTRIEFAKPVMRIIHRVSEPLVEVIAFKTVAAAAGRTRSGASLAATD
ncbi:MAG TPA: hypothetical protein VMF50_13010 [Candidatus Binataceae bacterium]|nr:hypothetical protein [Candidatus Binataceae bacterium]